MELKAKQTNQHLSPVDEMNTLSMSLSKDHINRLDEDDDESNDSDVESEIYESLRNSRR